MIRWMSCCAYLASIAWATGAPAQSASRIDKPSAAQRIVRVFDFEEQDVHGDPVPMHWVRAQDDPPIRNRRGFPSWNHAAFDLTVAHSGNASVKLPTRGGSTALELVPGVLPVIPGGDYEVAARIRTSDLQFARARLVARFADAEMAPISPSERSTPLIKSTDDWTPVSVQLPGDFPNAAWLTIHLELLQESAFPPELAPTTTQDLIDRPEDVAGAAWFDDVTVRLVPVLSLQTPRESGIVLAEETPIITGVVDDVVGDRLTATMTLLDLDGREQARHVVDPIRPGAPAQWRVAPPSFGWWRVRMDVASNGEPLASSTRDFVWVAQPRNKLERSRLSVALIESVDAPRTPLLALLDALAVGAVDLPLWRPGASRASLADAIPLFTTLLEHLLARELNVAFALESAPVDLAQELRVGEDEVLRTLATGRSRWSPWLDEALTRFGQRVRRWRLGPLESLDGRPPRLTARTFVDAAAPLSESVLNPIPTIPWSAELKTPESLNGFGIALKWPSVLRPESVIDLAHTWPAESELTVLIEPLSPQFAGRRDIAVDFAKRIVRAWQAEPDRIALMQPWTWRIARSGAASAEPTPEFAVWSRMGEHLRGRRVVGELPIADGVVALVLDGEAGGAIILWNEWAQSAQARLNAYLGPNDITAHDIFGNSEPVPFTEGVHRIRIPQSPLIIEGVDAELARFRAGFRVDPRHIESTAERHRFDLVVTNPWPVAISGDVQIVAPESWVFAPQTIAFTIAPGDQARFPVETSFGLAEEAGEHTIRARARLVATERYPTITVDAPVELSLTGVELIPSYQVRREADGDSVIVTLLVINTGEEPTTMMAFAQAPGAKRQQAPISELPPRGAAVRSFVFRHALDDLQDADVQVGVIESAGLGRLTRRIRIE